MKSYHPQISVKLVKTIRRTVLVPGGPTVSDRYRKTHSMDLTPFLGEAGAVRTSKSIREPYGSFSLTFGDQAHPELAETVYALVEPMDLVEIRFARAHHEYARVTDSGTAKGDLPIVMRGLVSSITRSESMAGDRPVRTVTIAGQDFGKILSIYQIHYLNNSKIGDNITHAFGYFQKYAPRRAARIKPVAQFINETLEDVINPFLERMSAVSDGRTYGKSSFIRRFIPDVTAEGYVSPNTLNGFPGGSLHQLLSTVLDVGPFNEMYVEDRPEGVALVVRPIPFTNVQGEYIQKGANAKGITVDSDAIESLTVSRSDSGVANYYWVTDDRWFFLSQNDQKQLAMQGNPDTYLPTNYLNSAEMFFGFRKMEAGNNLGPPNYFNRQDVAKQDKAAQDIALGGWLDERRRVLAELNKDNVLFESGTARLAGNERIKPGMYVRFRRGGNIPTTTGELSYRTDFHEVYAHRVDHEFLPFRGLFTTVQFDRGTGFIERAQRKEAPYRREIDAAGPGPMGSGPQPKPIVRSA